MILLIKFRTSAERAHNCDIREKVKNYTWADDVK